jgi:hypothetical protein
VRKYCLPCSEKTGKLVERVAPAKLSAERAAAERAAVARDARAEKRLAERAKHRDAVEGAQAAARALRTMPITKVAALISDEALNEAARRYSLLKAWEKPLTVTVVFRRSEYKPYTSGHAWSFRKQPGHGRIVVTVGSELADAHVTILHELAHVAAGHGHAHDTMWRSLYLLAAKELTGLDPKPEALDTRSVDVAVIAVMTQFLATAEVR